MAVEVESTGQIEEFLGLIKRRLGWILRPALIMLSLGVAVGVIVPKKYVTSTKVLVRETLASSGAPTRASQDTTGEARMAGHQIRSMNRITAVLLDLGWPEFLELGRAEQLAYVKKVRENVDVDVPNTPGNTGQVIVTVEYAHTDPDRAFDFLTSLVAMWKSEVLEQGINAETAAFNDLKQRKLALERERDELTDRITEQRKEYRIPVSAEQARGNAPLVAPVFSQLAENETQLEEAELEIGQLEATLAAERERLNRLPDRVPVEERPEADHTRDRIEAARGQIFGLQQEIKEKGLKPANSRYKAIRSQIDALEEEIRILEETEVAVISEPLTEPNKRRLALIDEIEQMESQLDQLKTKRQGLQAVLERNQQEASELQEVYAQISTWISTRNQIEAELKDVTLRTAEKQQAVQWVEGPGGNPFEVLEDVERPTKPSEPNPTLIVFMFLFLGLGAGFGLALLTEFTKNCFRTVGDVGRVMFVPVLGTINTIETRGQRNRRRFVSLLGSGLTLGFVGLVGFITWAWTSKPELLSTRVLTTLENIQEALK